MAIPISGANSKLLGGSFQFTHDRNNLLSLFLTDVVEPLFKSKITWTFLDGLRNDFSHNVELILMN